MFLPLFSAPSQGEGFQLGRRAQTHNQSKNSSDHRDPWVRLLHREVEENARARGHQAVSAEKTLLAGIGSALTIAGSITKATNGPRLLLSKLGWDLPPGVEDIGLAGLDMARVGTHLTAWSDLANDPEAATEDQVLALAQLADRTSRRTRRRRSTIERQPRELPKFACVPG